MLTKYKVGVESGRVTGPELVITTRAHHQSIFTDPNGQKTQAFAMHCFITELFLLVILQTESSLPEML